MLEIAVPGPAGALNSLRHRTRGSVLWLGPTWRSTMVEAAAAAAAAGRVENNAAATAAWRFESAVAATARRFESTAAAGDAAGRRLENAAAAAAAAACAYKLAVRNHCSKSQFEVAGLGFTSLRFSALCFT